MSFSVTLSNNRFERSGRPEFISSTKKNIEVKVNLEDRRHILHGATQITDMLIDSFNRFIKAQGIQKLEILVDGFLKNFKQRGISFRIPAKANLTTKIMKVITIAFSNPQNLVVGLAVQNQGIEKARETIHTVRKKIDEYCVLTISTFDELKIKVIGLITSSLDGSKRWYQ